MDGTLVLVSIGKKIYQTLKTAFDLIYKHLEGRQKYSAALRSYLRFFSISVFGNVVKHDLSCLIYYIYPYTLFQNGGCLR